MLSRAVSRIREARVVVILTCINYVDQLLVEPPHGLAAIPEAKLLLTFLVGLYAKTVLLAHVPPT